MTVVEGFDKAEDFTELAVFKMTMEIARAIEDDPYEWGPLKKAEFFGKVLIGISKGWFADPADMAARATNIPTL